MHWQPANPALSELKEIVLLAEPEKRFEGDGPKTIENPDGFDLAEWVQRHARGLAWETYRRLFLDSLKLYRALPPAIEYHASTATFRLVCGPNQGGKTAAVNAEKSRIMRGKHPRFPKKNGLMLCVGRDDDHLSQVMWKELTSPGQFDLVLDEVTSLPRAVRPDPASPTQRVDPIDTERKEQWFPAPAFLPRGGVEVEGGHLVGRLGRSGAADQPHSLNGLGSALASVRRKSSPWHQGQLRAARRRNPPAVVL